MDVVTAIAAVWCVAGVSAVVFVSLQRAKVQGERWRAAGPRPDGQGRLIVKIVAGAVLSAAALLLLARWELAVAYIAAPLLAYAGLSLLLRSLERDLTNSGVSRPTGGRETT